MKQTLVAVAVLLLLITGSILHIHALRNLTEVLSADILETITHCSDRNRAGAESSLSDAKNRWEDYKLYLHMFLHHETVDDTDETFQEALSALTEEDYPEAISTCQMLLEQFKRLLRDEKPCLKSIF